MSEHTKGPWRQNPSLPSFIHGADGQCVAEAFGLARTEEEHRANARLIAVAPDLLAACELGDDRDTGPAFLRYVAARLRECGHRGAAQWVERKATAEEAAMKKAHGEGASDE